MTLEEVLRKTLKNLSDSGADCAVVGGLAVSVRVDPRFTRDVDLAVAVKSDKEAEQVIRALIQSGYHLRYEVSSRVKRDDDHGRRDQPPTRRDTSPLAVVMNHFSRSGKGFIDDSLPNCTSILCRM